METNSSFILEQIKPEIYISMYSLHDYYQYPPGDFSEIR